jgi:hypothetical protein
VAAAAAMAAVLMPSCCVATAEAELSCFRSRARRLLNQTWTRASVSLVLETRKFENLNQALCY